MSNRIRQLDQIIERSLRELAADTHVRRWRAKENDWVSYFAHRHLLGQCSPRGPLKEAGQICIEVAVPQPSDRQKYKKPSVRRDLVIWPECGDACFGDDWSPCKHPLAIVEWTVYHRPKHKKKKHIFEKERQWLRDYCKEQRSVLGYAILIDGTCDPRQLRCSRFLGLTEDHRWLEFTLN
jgi:hypothetical protein